MFCAGGEVGGKGQAVTSTVGTASDLAMSYTRFAASGTRARSESVFHLERETAVRAWWTDHVRLFSCSFPLA